jgi:hypothetical protein
MSVGRELLLDVDNKTPSNPRDADIRRLRILWIGLGLYFLIVLNALRYVHRVPYPIFIAGCGINIGIILAIIVAMRRVYRRLRQ